MAINRILVAQDGDENQILKTDNITKFLVNHCSEWQFLFNPNSELTNSAQVVKLSAEFDTTTFNKIRMVGYLYNTVSGGIDSASSCIFNIYRVAQGNWNDVLITTITGDLQPNSYYFKDIDLSSLSPADLDGDTTLMIECFIVRLSQTYRDRIYVNHLGVYDSIVRLKSDIEFLDISKQDL